MSSENAAPADSVRVHRIESRRTRIQRIGTARRLRIAAIIAVVTACPASLVMMALAESSIRWLANVGPLLAFPLAVSPIAMLVASAALGAIESSRAGSVSVTGSALRLERGDGRVFEVPVSGVESAFLRDLHGEAQVHFVLRNRNVVRIDVRDVAEGEALVRAAGLDPWRRSASVTLRHTGLTWLYWALAAPLLVGGVTAAAIGFQRAIGGAGSTDGAIGAGVVLGLVVALLGGRTLLAEVTVGNDGVTVRRAFETHFLPFDDLERVEYRGGVISFVTLRGPSYEIWVTADREPSPGALVERIQQVWRRARNGLKAEGHAALARKGRGVAEWKKALADAIRGTDGYRAVALSLDELRRVLADASAPAEHRIAAALALGASHDASDRVRVRVAIDATASARVRVAIAHAADGKLDEKEIDAAVEEARGAAASVVDPK